MKPIKKLEIILDAVERDGLLKVLDAFGVSGYSVIENVAGKGQRGSRAGYDITGALGNTYVITACAEEQLSGLVEAIRPLLARYGGVCFVSDAQWIIH